MRVKLVTVLMTILTGALTANGQGMMSDLMSGKLVNPEVGVFAWYSLTDGSSDREFFLRQAVVGTEKVNRKEAYWLETELVPKVGFPSVYKMLLTGPAEDPENVHRLIVREGQGPIQDVEIDRSKKPESVAESPRSAVTLETLTISGTEIQAERFTVEENGETTEIWVSDQVRPMGLVRMKSSQGELMLQRFGVGGNDGKSALLELQSPNESADESKKSDEEPRTNFRGRRTKR